LAMVVLWWVGIGIAAVVLVSGAAAVWWWVPKWQMRSITAADPKARADIEDNFRKTVGQALGGPHSGTLDAVGGRPHQQKRAVIRP
jgi:hypothetical protein